jgi:hypothetical protein
LAKIKTKSEILARSTTKNKPRTDGLLVVSPYLVVLNEEL